MRKIAYSIIVLLTVLSCTSRKKSVVDITASNMADSTQIIIYKLNINQLHPVDTVFVMGGKSVCELDINPSSPDFYYLSVPGKGRIPLLVSTKDRLAASFDDNTVTGSAEAELFNRMESEFSEFTGRFAAGSARLAKVSDPQDRKQISDELVKSFVEFKKKSIKQVITDPASMVNLPVLFRKITPDLPLFGDENDVYLMQRVYDTLSVVYPESPYITALGREIDSRKGNRELADMISSAPAVSYPDIELPDISGQQRKLTELSGRVILLVFWNTGMANSAVMNAELKGLYAKYHASGLEIYQVSLDPDKTAWAGAVKNQGLEWVSVIDTRGSNSVYVPLYYVDHIPSAYVIGRDGSILLKDVVDISKLDSVISGAVK